MTTKTYPKLGDGEPLFIDKGNVLRFACCDCDLVHDIRFETVKNKGIIIKMFRNSRSTGQLRRHRKDLSKTARTAALEEAVKAIRSKQDELIASGVDQPRLFGLTNAVDAVKDLG